MLEHIETLSWRADVGTGAAPLPELQVERSAEELLTPWLLDRVHDAARLVVESARGHEVTLDRILVSGFTSYEECDRQLVLACWATATDAAAFAFWDDLAPLIDSLNQPPPRRAKHADVRLVVEVRWDCRVFQ
jgi:hypothetical protein